MRLIILAFLAISPLAALEHLPQISDASSDVDHELSELNALITVTEEMLTAEKKVRFQVEEYSRLRQLYLRDGDDRELLFRIIKAAYTLRETIHHHHLDHAFSKSFIEELDLFAQVANKRSLPRSP